jgi:hypothetical protein
MRHESIAMSNVFIRRRSPGLFAGGVFKIRRVYYAGSDVITVNKIFEKTVKD